MKLDYLYGTAWKEEITSECVFNAIKTGYRAIDSANQRKHYNEPGTGEGLLKAYKKLGLKREDLFLQTKFTHVGGQDQRKPYNENDPLKTQVRCSFENSLKLLHTDYIDSYILHGPCSQVEFTDQDKEVWLELEALHKEDLVKNIGASNITMSQLEEIYDFATIKPTQIQIRSFAENRWEKDQRDFCKEHNITFQGFSLLTANRKFFGHEVTRPSDRNVPKLIFSDDENTNNPIDKIMIETGKTHAQIIYKFAQQVGMLPVTGTRDIKHMKLNLEILDFELSDDQIEMIENIAF